MKRRKLFMSMKQINKKAIALLTSLTLAVSGLTVFPMAVQAADAVDANTGWRKSIMVDFGTGMNINEEGVDTDVDTTNKFGPTLYSNQIPDNSSVVGGYGDYLYTTNDVGVMYGGTANGQKFGFDRILPAGVTNEGGAYFRDWVFSPDGEEYELSMDLLAGYYYVYVYTGNKTTDYNNATFVSFGDTPGKVWLDQSSAGGSQWGTSTEYDEAVYTVKVTDDGAGKGTLKLSFKDNTMGLDGYESYHNVLVNDNPNTIFALNGLAETDCNGKIATARLNGIEVIPMESPVPATAIQATSIGLEVGQQKDIDYTVTPSNSTDRIEFVSQDPAIAEVDVRTGTVTGKANGSTTITINTPSLAQPVSVPVTVSSETTLTIDKTSMTLRVGDTANAAGENVGTVKVTFSAASSEAARTTLILPVYGLDESPTVQIEEINESATAGLYEATIKITANTKGTTAVSISRETGKVVTCDVTVERAVDSVVFLNSQNNVTTEYLMMTGNTLTVKATGKPDEANNKNVTYELKNSSDSSVAAINSSGKITAYKAGTVTIVATSKDDTTKSAEATVTVIPAISAVTLSSSALTLNPNKTAALTAKLVPVTEGAAIPNQNITWSSSRPEIATVENGTVKALKIGETTITVTTEDGGLTAACKVTVKAASIPATQVSVKAGKTTLAKIGDSTTVTATMTPGNTTDTITWKSTNTKVATVTNDGKVVAKGPGKTDIVATATSGKSGKVTITVKVPATKLTVKNSISVNVGKTKTVKATVKPSNTTDKIKWSVKNSKIVKLNVKQGKTVKITGKKKGSTTITVKAGKKSKKIKVTVK